MKPLKHIISSMLLALVLLSHPSCSSDPNPVGYLNTTGEKTTIELSFSVADTRAADDVEKSITSVNLYIFNNNNILEQIENVNVSTEGKAIAKITPGQKTIYAISASPVFVEAPKVDETTITDFENLILNTTSGKLTNNGFVMVGKSVTKIVVASKTPQNLDDSNIFKITLERLVSKVQLKKGNIQNSVSGLYITDEIYYKVCQTKDKIGLVNAISDVGVTYRDSETKGTFDGYTFNDQNISYQKIQQSAFTSGNCHYVTENIVSSPKSGNTTFVCVRVETYPETLRYVDNRNGFDEIFTKDNYSPVTYTVIGIFDENGNFLDFYMDNKNKIMCFESREAAIKYLDELGVTPNPSITYDYLTYENGYAYYRINIAKDVAEGQTKKYEIVRNTFYKITLNSIKTLGMPSIDDLRPNDANTPLETASSTAAWIDATFSVAPWSEGSQSADL